MIERSLRLPSRPAAVVIALLAVVSALLVVPATSTPAVVASTPAQASKYTAISPVRVLDTRLMNDGFIRAGETLTIDPLTSEVVNAAAVAPTDITAVAINLTITQPLRAGFLSSWPTGIVQASEVDTSVVNNRDRDETIANSAIIPVGNNGLITIGSAFGSHAIVDVQGVFTRAQSSRAGRFVPLDVPQRALDTRTTGATLASRSAVVVDLTETVGVPRTASAAVINLVAANTQEPGFLTAYPGGSPPLASNVNYPGGGFNIAGSSITQLDDGNITVFASGRTDLIIDVVGYMTGDDADDTSDGLFVAISPERVYDSRPDQRPLGTTSLSTRQSRAVAIEGQPGIPADGVLGISANITMTNTDGPGFLVAYPRDPVPPNYSTVNSVFVNHSIANHAVVALDDGSVSVFSRNRSDFIVDVTGYFLEAGATVPTAPPPPRIDPSPNPDVVPGPVAEPPFDPNFTYLAFAGSSPRAPYVLNGQRYFGWDPCQPITYAVNALRATQSQVDALNEAIKIVEAATGFDFQYLGEARGSLQAQTIDERVVGGGSAMAVFGFSDASETPELAGGVIGLGGTTLGRAQLSPITLQPGAQFAYIVRGGFAIADVNDLTGREELINTFVHEIGHMIGLDHVNTPGEIMRGVIPFPPQTTLGPGDRYGFWSIGAPQCIGARLTTAATEQVSNDDDIESVPWLPVFEADLTFAD